MNYDSIGKNQPNAMWVSLKRRILTSSVAFVAGILCIQESATAFQPSTRLRASGHALFARGTKVVDVDVIAESKSRLTKEDIEEKSFMPFFQKETGQEDQTLFLDNGEPQLSDEDTKKKYLILALLWVTTCLSALDRVAMSVALVPISDEFGISSTIKGSISSVFSLGYGLFILPAGLLVGNLSPRKVMMFGVALWSIATLATPTGAGSMLIAGMLPLFIARACVGAGESIVIPSTQRFLSVWTTPEEKSRALAFVLSGFAFGKIGAYLVSPLIMDSLGGWRELFYFYGVFGTLLLLPWLFLGQDEPASAGTAIASDSTTVIGDKEEVNAMDEAIRIFQEAPWKDMAQSKGVWAMTLAHCAKNWGLYNWLTWTPTFYAEHYHIGVKDSAWLSVTPGIAGVLGGAAAGLLADNVIKNMNDENDEQEKTRIRKSFQAVGLLGPAASVGILAWHIPENAWVAQLCLAGAFGLMGFNIGGFEAANQEKAGSRWAGLLYGVTSLPGVLAGTGGVYLTGQILDATNQDWSIVFGINALVNMVGAAAFMALYNSKKEFD